METRLLVLPSGAQLGDTDSKRLSNLIQTASELERELTTCPDDTFEETRLQTVEKVLEVIKDTINALIEESKSRKHLGGVGKTVLAATFFAVAQHAPTTAASVLLDAARQDTAMTIIVNILTETALPEFCVSAVPDVLMAMLTAVAEIPHTTKETEAGFVRAWAKVLGAVADKQPVMGEFVEAAGDLVAHPLYFIRGVGLVIYATAAVRFARTMRESNTEPSPTAANGYRACIEQLEAHGRDVNPHIRARVVRLIDGIHGQGFINKGAFAAALETVAERLVDKAANVRKAAAEAVTHILQSSRWLGPSLADSHRAELEAKAGETATMVYQVLGRIKAALHSVIVGSPQDAPQMLPLVTTLVERDVTGSGELVKAAFVRCADTLEAREALCGLVEQIAITSQSDPELDEGVKELAWSAKALADIAASLPWESQGRFADVLVQLHDDKGALSSRLAQTLVLVASRAQAQVKLGAWLAVTHLTRSKAPVDLGDVPVTSLCTRHALAVHHCYCTALSRRPKPSSSPIWPVLLKACLTAPTRATCAAAAVSAIRALYASDKPLPTAQHWIRSFVAKDAIVGLVAMAECAVCHAAMVDNLVAAIRKRPLETEGGELEAVVGADPRDTAVGVAEAAFDRSAPSEQALGLIETIIANTNEGEGYSVEARILAVVAAVKLAVTTPGLRDRLMPSIQTALGAEDVRRAAVVGLGDLFRRYPARMHEHAALAFESAATEGPGQVEALLTVGSLMLSDLLKTTHSFGLIASLFDSEDPAVQTNAREFFRLLAEKPQAPVKAAVVEVMSSLVSGRLTPTAFDRAMAFLLPRVPGSFDTVVEKIFDRVGQTDDGATAGQLLRTVQFIDKEKMTDACWRRFSDNEGLLAKFSENEEFTASLREVLKLLAGKKEKTEQAGAAEAILVGLIGSA
ncbi:Condensation complex subunit 1 CND1 [Carpediemonas membranifera]|uniref:Condensation complex subunit 1 CND1 n=1 Tax=Carpediemonas membranifera TaxID=201153 RepID=A0A8J6AQJ8_9EUKA|nr:Condensation complex subunit 1 CND1 [Carpediemonas membranifera]|eukprot:KAG9391123.1 Condensation complex subunit 1 CND1 [Carpediemonas membranifera]